MDKLLKIVEKRSQQPLSRNRQFCSYSRRHLTSKKSAILYDCDRDPLDSTVSVGRIHKWFIMSCVAEMLSPSLETSSGCQLIGSS